MSRDGDRPCPRHNEVCVDPSLRCDCPSTVHAGAGPIKRGKWVRAVLRVLEERLGTDATEEERAAAAALGDAIEEHANNAVDEALLAGYHLGLKGGVPPGDVRECDKCGESFVAGASSTAQRCVSCWAEENL